MEILLLRFCRLCTLEGDKRRIRSPILPSPWGNRMIGSRSQSHREGLRHKHMKSSRERSRENEKNFKMELPSTSATHIITCSSFWSPGPTVINLGGWRACPWEKQARSHRWCLVAKPRGADDGTWRHQQTWKVTVSPTTHQLNTE